MNNQFNPEFVKAVKDHIKDCNVIETLTINGVSYNVYDTLTKHRQANILVPVGF